MNTEEQKKKRKKSQVVIIAMCGVLLVGCLGCLVLDNLTPDEPISTPVAPPTATYTQSKPEGPSAPVPTITPTLASIPTPTLDCTPESEPQVINIAFCTGKTDDGKPDQVVTQLPAGTERLCAVWYFVHIRSGLSWHTDWYLEEKKEVVNFGTWDMGTYGTKWTCISVGDGVLPDGQYTLKIYVEGTLLAEDYIIIGSGNESPTAIVIPTSLPTNVPIATLTPTVLPTSSPIPAATAQPPQPTAVPTEPPPTEPPTPVAVCDCSSNIYNCSDFTTHAQAQACYDYCVFQGRGDIHKLDGNDNDGQACESLP